MPDITDRETLKAWLDTRPREDGVLIAARCALRVLPLIEGVLPLIEGVLPLIEGVLRADPGKNRAAIILPIFRATVVASFAGTWPKQATGAAAAAAARAADDAAAARAADDAAYAARGVDADAAAAYAADAADDAAYAARAAAYAAYAADDADDAAYAARAADAAAYAADAADAAADADAAYAAAAYAAVQSDAEALEAGTDHAALSATPLWADGIPKWVVSHWQDLETHLLAVDEGWQVWTDWYEDRLYGRPAIQSLEYQKVLIPNEIWQSGPKPLNTEIAHLIAEHEGRNDVPKDTGRGHPPKPPGPRLPEDDRWPHDYEPATAGLAHLSVTFDGDLGDDRVEAELSRFAALLRHKLIGVTEGRAVPLVLGNNQQVDMIGLSRLSVQPGSVSAKFVVTLTCIGAVWGMVATYGPFKEGLAEVKADVSIAIEAAVNAFNDTLPDDPPLTVTRRDPVFRDDEDVLADLLDAERQDLLRGMRANGPHH